MEMILKEGTENFEQLSTRLEINAEPTRMNNTRKRKATAEQSRKGKMKRGLLKEVVDLPMDILFEIFGQLEPVDLLSLARTTKSLRAILISRSSISIWKQAFGNVTPPGLPECPKDLSEPQYAELVFGKTCTFCDRKLAIIHTAWEARVRTCNKCLDAHFEEKWRLFSQIRTYDMYEYCISFSIHRSGRRREQVKVYAYKDVLERWSDEHQILGSDEKQTWRLNKIEEVKVIRKHASECKVWADTRQSDIDNEKATTIEEHKTIVLDYLNELGWGDELSKIPPGFLRPEQEPAVIKFCQKEVTQQGLQSMKGYFNEYMEAVRSRRILREQGGIIKKRIVVLKNTFEKYLTTLRPDVFYPNTAEILQDLTLKTIVFDPTTPELLAEELDALRRLFPDILSKWQESIKPKLIKVIEKASGQTDFTFDPTTVLDLATTTFYCANCCTYLSSRHSIMHRCAWALRSCGYGSDSQLIESAIQQVAWDPRHLSFNPKISEQMAKALQMCSFDPMTTTVQQLEELNPIFECLICHAAVLGRYTLKWCDLSAHAAFHMSSRTLRFILVDEGDAAKVRARMREEFERFHACQVMCTMCTQCRMLGTRMMILEHIRQAHKVAGAIPDVDLVIPPDVRPYPSKFYLWPPRILQDVQDMEN